MKKMLFIILMSLALVGCSEDMAYRMETGKATVTDKDYDAAWNQPVMVGKVTSMIYHPADYDLELTYKDIVQWVSVDKAIYEQVEIGAQFPVNVFYGYNTDGVLKEKYFKISEGLE